MIGNIFTQTVRGCYEICTLKTTQMEQIIKIVSGPSACLPVKHDLKSDKPAGSYMLILTANDRDIDNKTSTSAMKFIATLDLGCEIMCMSRS